MSGLRLRAPGSIQTTAIEMLDGAVIGNIGPTEIAEGISRGLLDGTLMDWIGIKEFRIDQMTSHHAELDFGRLALMLPMNKATYDRLPEPAKAAFAKHGGIAFAQTGGKAFDEAVDTFRTTYAGQGDTVTELSADELTKLEGTFGEVVNEWVAEAEGRDAVLETFKTAAESAQ
jgi:TRAP-type C4-dicarboxylate transport system substrate-binding protein